jgi:branched-chain amino acid aminotransferase
VFRLEDHVRRLLDSAHICGLKIPFTHEQLVHACIETLEANQLRDAYLRPIVYQDDGNLGGLGSNPPVHVAIAANVWGAYLGDDGVRKGIRVHLSAFRRSGLGSALPKREARGMGFEEALLMDDDANIAEGSGENLFVVCDGILKTPPTSAPILPGLTRATVLHLARRGLETFGLSDIREENISRGELLVADEVFLTGTAAEITPVRQVDLHVIGRGEPGPITRGLQKAYFELVRGRGPAPAHWRTSFGALVR